MSAGTCEGCREELTWIVRFESDDEVALWFHHEGVPTHWGFRKVMLSVGVVKARIWRSSVDGLEVVPVQMERVPSDVIVVQDYLDDVVLVQHMSVGV